MPRLLMIASMQRTGSTNLMTHFDAFGSTRVYGELFCRYLFERNIEMYRRMFGALDGRSDLSLDELYRIHEQEPMMIAQAALADAEAAGKDFAVFKLFPAQLPMDAVHALIDRFRPAAAVLTRAPADMYISLKKTRLTGRYSATDTTEVLPKLDATEFRRWLWEQEHYLQLFARSIARAGLPATAFTYEELYAGPRGPVELVRTRFADIGVELGSPVNAVKEMARQDRAADRASRVANWSEFESKTRKIMRGEKLDAFDVVGNPLLLDLEIAVRKVLPRGALVGMARRMGLIGGVR